MRRERPAGASTQCLAFRKADFQGQFVDLLLLMPVFWLMVGSPGHPPAHALLSPDRDRKRGWTPAGQTHAYPLLHTSPSPPPNSVFTECSAPHVVWEGYEHCVYAVRLQAEVCEAAVFVCARV